MLEIYVPFYNSVFCAEYQAKTLRAFLGDDVQLIFIDNNMGRHPKASEGLITVCKENNIPLIINEDKACIEFQRGIEAGSISTSDKLGWTLNLIWTLVQQRKPEYFGFLDQDCFAFKPVRLREYLDKNGAYGKVVPTHPDENQHKINSGEWVWNLHVMANFFKTEFLVGKEVNFMPGSWADKFAKQPVVLDVGGMNWHSIYRSLDRSKYVLPEEHYLYFDDTSLLNPDGKHPTRVLYEVLDNKWVHMVHGANSSDGSDFLKPKTSYLKGFLDFALLNHRSIGATLRPDFTPTYRDRNRHKAFYPQWTTIPDHDADDVITQYVKDKIFVETGTCLGRSVKHALVRGAKEVRSVEGAEIYYEECKNIFANDPRVKLWLGNSVDKLPEMIEGIDEPVVFFLDAHPTGENHIGTSFGHVEQLAGDDSYVQHNILMQELEIIASHPVKGHVVLIDDQLRNETELHKQYKKILLKGNPNYKFRLCNKPVFDSNNEKVFLVAESD